MQVSGRLVLPELSPVWMARALGVLYTCGATQAMVWVALPHSDHGGDGVVLAMASVAVVLGLSLCLGPTGRLPRWCLHVIIAAIQVVISVAFVAVGHPGNDIRLYYAWATPYAAFFFGRRAAIGHTVWTVACLTVSLASIAAQPAETIRTWLMTTGLVVAVATLVLIVADRMRRSQALLHAAALTDPLTGLPNRRAFSASLEDALEALTDDEATQLAVLLVDLDHFKIVNDLHGHHAGDSVLSQIAPRLVAAVRPDDLVARMGGDEFAVVCRDVSGRLDLEDLVDRLRACWLEPVTVEGVELQASGSVGLVVAGADDTAESLLRDADVALYQAKGLERGSVVRFDESMRVGVGRRSQLERGLRLAIERDELQLAFQPVVELDGETTVGVEALLRWTSSELGVVSPAEFIPVAEEAGLIGEVGDWAFETGCATLAAWRRDGLVGDDFTLALNVSGRQLKPGFVARVAEVLRAHDLPAHAVHIEITESVLLDETPATARALGDLERLGTPLLLDDFGTGYASLSYLQRLPLRAIKIDRSFVADVHASPRRRVLVSTILAMADSLGLDVIAEGVETCDVASTLRGLGCGRAQGYLWARPEPAEVASARLREGALGLAADPL